MKSRIVVVFSAALAASHLHATPTNLPEGFTFGSSTGLWGAPILPYGFYYPDMVFSTDYSSIWLESKTSGYQDPEDYNGGINMVGSPIRFFPGAENSYEGYGKFQICDYGSQFTSSYTPLFELDSGADTAKFNGVNVEVNSGTLKVAGSPVLTSALSSIAIGSTAAATGLNSSAFGLGNTSQGYNQFVVGQYNTLQGTGTANSNPGDALFLVGNGSGTGSRSNAFTVERSGNVRVGASLAVGSGSTVSGNRAVAMGQSGADGHYSTALGVSGTYSTATYSTAMGNSATYAQYATAMGNAAAGGIYATAMGKSTANAHYGTAMGDGTVAQAYASTVIGSFNLAGNPDHTQWVATDDVFIVGNGVNASNRSNAMVVKKNGSLAAGSGTVIGTVPTGSSQIVVGAYNDTSTEATTPATDRGKGVFTVGAGTSTVRKNALRVTTSGKVLVQPSGELSMGTFVSGEKP